MRPFAGSRTTNRKPCRPSPCLAPVDPSPAFARLRPSFCCGDVGVTLAFRELSLGGRAGGNAGGGRLGLPPLSPTSRHRERRVRTCAACEVQSVIFMALKDADGNILPARRRAAVRGKTADLRSLGVSSLRTDGSVSMDVVKAADYRRCRLADIRSQSRSCATLA